MKSNLTDREKVLSLCKKYNVPVARLEKELDFSNAYLTKIKGFLPTDRMKKICNYFKIPYSYFLENDVNNVCTIPEEMFEIFTLYSKLSPPKQNTVKKLLKYLNENK